MLWRTSWILASRTLPDDLYETTFEKKPKHLQARASVFLQESAIRYCYSRSRYHPQSHYHSLNCFHSLAFRPADVSACGAAVLVAGHRLALPAEAANRALHRVSAHYSLALDCVRDDDHARENLIASRVTDPFVDPTPGFRALYESRVR